MRPQLVVQVRYTEMTDEGRLRHPTYLGLRDDKAAADVTMPRKKPAAAARAAKAAAVKASREGNAAEGGPKRRRPPPRPVPRPVRRSRRRVADPLAAWDPTADALIAQIDDLERRRKDGKLTLPDGQTLDITNPHKVFWPDGPRTKARSAALLHARSRRCCCRCSRTGRW